MTFLTTFNLEVQTRFCCQNSLFLPYKLDCHCTHHHIPLQRTNAGYCTEKLKNVYLNQQGKLVFYN